MKTCTECNIEKPFDEFPNCKAGKNGKNSKCRVCVRKKYEIYISDPVVYERRKRVQREHYRNLNSEQKDRIKLRESKRKDHRSAYARNRRKDPMIAYKERIGASIRKALRKQHLNKETRTAKIVGCSYNELFEYLKHTAVVNYGKYDSSIKYEIDHIIPLSSAKTLEDVEKLNHYTNLQLLTHEDNIKKYTKSWSEIQNELNIIQSLEKKEEDYE